MLARVCVCSEIDYHRNAASESHAEATVYLSGAVLKASSSGFSPLNQAHSLCE